MTRIDLTGPWTLTRCATGDTYPAQVPGCAWSDLLRAEVIPDPFWRDEEATQQWIGQEDWQWQRSFDCAAEDLTDLDGAELVCEGLDTLATVWVNDVQVLRTDNMFRTWRVDVQALLQTGSNIITVRCDSTLPYLARKREQLELREWNIYQEAFKGRGWIRKMACSYGWDWGPMIPTAGIWRTIGIELQRGPRIADLHVRQTHHADTVDLHLDWQAFGPAAATAITVRSAGQNIATAEVPAGTTCAQLTITDPHLWWPVDLGDQPLYEVVVTPEAGREATTRIGLRTLELVRESDAAGESFGFRVNGLPVYAKGANWIPTSVFPGASADEDMMRLLDDAAAAHMNMLRVWGGGLYESDAFYDACDERGILIWQDCAFACGDYPWSDGDFQANVAAEAADNARRLRHHPSLALWCGNNEIEMGQLHRNQRQAYERFMDEQLPAWIAAEDPDTPYWPSSSHTPIGNRDWANDDASGDAHHWTVFFGNKPIEFQRTWRCRFMSEYGFQSMPDRRTIAAFTDPSDRAINTPIMDYHQRSQVGNRVMLSYALDWLPAPTDLESTIHVTQLVHALCVRYAAEHLRRLQPHNQGCLFWQINDLWPCLSWSSIDHAGRWKVLQYDAARAFAPVLVSLCEDDRPARVAVHVSNQRRHDERFHVRWEIGDTDGAVLSSGSDTVHAPAQSDRQVTVLDVEAFCDQRHKNDVLVWAWVTDEAGTVLSRNCVSICRPKHLSLADPGITTTLVSDGEQIWVELSCRKPAWWVQLDLVQADAWWEDNHFHLHPDEPRRILLRRGPDRATLEQELQVSSLADLMPHRRLREDELAAPQTGRIDWYKHP